MITHHDGVFCSRTQQQQQQDAHRGERGVELRDLVPVQQAAQAAGEHIRRGAGEVPDGEVRRALVPGEAVPRLGVPVHQDRVAHRSRVREGVPGERRGHTGRAGEPAAGPGRLGGPGRGELPHRREGRREDPVQRERRRVPVRRARRPDRRPRGDHHTP